MAGRFLHLSREGQGEELSSATERESAVLDVTVTQITPLTITTFSAQGCLFGFCAFNVGHAITFVETVTGDPDHYDYDWDGSGGGNCNDDAAFEASGFTTPQTSHAYATAGTFTPVLRIRRGAEKVCFTHQTALQISQRAAGVDLGHRPATGSVNTSYNFTASAQNCTPAANGWTWTTGGGSGSSSTDSISITWTTTGTKSVTAKNSACGSSVVGSRSIVLSGSSGGGGLTANFTFSPANPTAGQAVSFNGSSSTGTIGTYAWQFGDGGSASGATATHTYNSPGTFTATLSVLAPGCVSPSCIASLSKTVTVGGGSNSVTAHFTYSPANPRAGETVSFDGRSTTGSVATYGWDFGDGGQAGGASTATGSTVDHVFAAAGTYQVTLNALPTDCVSPSCISSEHQTVVVSAAALGCTPSSDTVCLLDGRFKVAVHFRDQRSGKTGLGQVLPFPNTGQSGAFWFFRNTNPELLVKMVDATTLPENPAFWVFYGSLTDVEYWLDVTDTRGDADPGNDVVKEYHNLPGTICGTLDTGAFPQGSPLIGGGGGTVVDLLRTGFEAPDAGAAIAGASGTCTPTGANLCLLGGRFSVEVSFRNQHDNNAAGEGTAVPGTEQSGYFWFFNPNNLELVVKMVDGTVGGGNGHFWVFWGGTTDVEYTLRVTDTVAHTTWESPTRRGTSAAAPTPRLFRTQGGSMFLGGGSRFPAAEGEFLVEVRFPCLAGRSGAWRPYRTEEVVGHEEKMRSVSLSGSSWSERPGARNRCRQRQRAGGDPAAPVFRRRLENCGAMAPGAGSTPCSRSTTPRPPPCSPTSPCGPTSRCRRSTSTST